jgi:hypothetical protein
MRKLYKTTLFLTLGALCLGIGTSLRAAIIFNNSTNDLVTRFTAGTNEVGDEILLKADSTERYLTNFSFEFWGTNTANPAVFSSPVEFCVRFYQNDGPLFNSYRAPGTKFYDSGWWPIAPTPLGRATEIFTLWNDFGTGQYLPVTSNMTWSVQFRGMGTTDSVGVDIYSPPVVGQDYPDYWVNTNGGWMLVTNNAGVHIDFAAVMEASAVPVVNPNPPWLTNVVSGSNLLLSWDAGHVGWKLQVQTNSVNVGISNNWHTIAGSDSTNAWSLPIDRTKGSVFCRLINP